MTPDFDGVFPEVESLTTKRGRGRPPATADPAQRQQHIELALLYFGGNWTIARVAMACDVSLRTAHRWIRLALTYEEPEADLVRTLAQNYRRKLKYLDP